MVPTMTPITDPNLISQLEQPNIGQQPSMGQPVSDPALIAQLEGNAPAQPFSLSNMAAGALTNLGQGGADVLAGLSKAGMGLANTPSNVANLVSRYFPNAISPQAAAQVPRSPISGSDIDQAFGTQNRGMIGNLLEGGARYAPYALGGEALGATGLAGDAATGGAYGATQSPNPLTGGAVGAGTNAALSLLPLGLGKAAAGINYLKPQEYANNIVSQLSGGLGLEQSGKSLTQDINNSFQQKTAYGSNNYFQPVLNQVGDTSIYSHFPTLPTGIGDAYRPDQGLYENISPDIKNSFNGDIKNLNNTFSQNPTFSNAHELQQQLGNEIGALQYTKNTRGLDSNQQSLLDNYTASRNALKSDMSSFLGATDPALQNLWGNGVDYWRNEVAPYYADSSLRALATGEETNPTNSAIASIFRNPSSEIGKVVSDLPDSSKGKILYSMLGKTSAVNSPEGLIRSFQNLDQQGLSSYVPDSLSQQIASLGSRIKARNVAQMGAGGAAGLLAAHPLGNIIPMPMLEPLAIGGGAMLGKGLGGALQKVMPNTQFSSFLSQALQKAYPGVRAAVVPNVVGGQ
jgi:hypothetical protein